MASLDYTDALPIVALAGIQIGDGIACAIPAQFITDALDRVNCPAELRPVLPVLKLSSAVGLILGIRSPRMALVTSVALVAYVSFALAAHARAHDRVANAVPAGLMLGFSAWIAKQAVARLGSAAVPG